MQTKNKIILLRISFWTGAIIDGIVGSSMLFPGFWSTFNGLNILDSTLVLNYALWFGAPLMLGWTMLLLWADRKPLERKEVLIITVFPVILGLMANNLFALTSQLVSFENIIPKLVIQSLLVLLFLFSYFNAKNIHD